LANDYNCRCGAAPVQVAGLGKLGFDILKQIFKKSGKQVNKAAKKVKKRLIHRGQKAPKGGRKEILIGNLVSKNLKPNGKTKRQNVVKYLKTISLNFYRNYLIVIIRSVSGQIRIIRMVWLLHLPKQL